jgi:hypothetical protein
VIGSDLVGYVDRYTVEAKERRNNERASMFRCSREIENLDEAMMI